MNRPHFHHDQPPQDPANIFLDIINNDGTPLTELLKERGGSAHTHWAWKAACRASNALDRICQANARRWNEQQRRG